MKTIDNISFKNEKALIRVDFNVPLDKTTLKVTDDTRIKAAIPTIRKVLNDGGAVVLMSHLGRPKGTRENKYSLSHTISVIEQLLGQKIKFADDCISPQAFELSSLLQPGEVLLLENLRFYPEEEKGDIEFAKKLAQHGTIYINDAFGTAHRAHASTTIVANFFPNNKKYFGYLMAKEVENLRKILQSPEKPFTAIVGGAKVSDKIKVLEALTKVADNIIIGGAMAFTFIKAKGGNIGKSLCENDHIETALHFLNQIEIKNAQSIKNIRVILPVDAVCASEFMDSPNNSVHDITDIPTDLMGLDIGPKSIQLFKDILASSKSILWNGPMGVFEFSNFETGTKEIAFTVAEITHKNNAFSVVGGGDSVAAINKYNLENQISFISTGGGAMLEFIENGTLPGIEAIESNTYQPV
ncbi:MAG: phosphoglycerate kinase [Bacteroidia bacterium]|nr:MAG: phosphoglycerate kinase [Bacteroidia bacterium]